MHFCAREFYFRFLLINFFNELYSVSVSPLNIRLLGAHQPLSAGRRYDLLCQSAGSRPPAVITWWRDGQRLEKTTETVSDFHFTIRENIVKITKENTNKAINNWTVFCSVFPMKRSLFLYRIVSLFVVIIHKIVFSRREQQKKKEKKTVDWKWIGNKNERIGKETKWKKNNFTSCF